MSKTVKIIIALIVAVAVVLVAYSFTKNKEGAEVSETTKIEKQASSEQPNAAGQPTAPAADQAQPTAPAAGQAQQPNAAGQPAAPAAAPAAGQAQQPHDGKAPVIQNGADK